MASGCDIESAQLARWAEWQSRQRTREMGAITEGNAAPMLFVAGEVLVGRDDRDLIEECLAKGGELIPPEPLIEAPPDVRRSRDLNPADFPMPARLRFAESVREEIPERTLPELQERWHKDGALRAPILVSDARAASLASFAGRRSSEGRSIILNAAGSPAALPLRTPLEGDGVFEGNEPGTWASFQAPTRVFEAWQLVESARVAKSIEPVVWIAILDSGFWVGPNGEPLPGTGETASDFGTGVAGVNIFAPGTNVGGPAVLGSSPWHGHGAASVAAALVGNSLGAAGTGGTVARPFLFKIDYTMDQTIKALRHITAWGLDVASMSYTTTITPFLWWDNVPSAYDATFQFAHDNGVIILAAAGNDNKKLPDAHIRPATRTPGVITVGALNVAPNPRDDSNYGSSVEIWAPGTDIPAAPHQAAEVRYSGTSAATPFVAGIAAMMRAVNPAIHPAKVKETLVRTGWPGPAGSKVTKGVDAYAAVLNALGGTLPADLWEPNQTTATAAPLHDTGGGVLRPLYGFATHAPGNADYWRFSLASVSDVTVTLDWYERLGDLTLRLEALDPDDVSIEDIVTTKTPGTIKLSGTLSPGGYVVLVAGGALTAYEVGVRPRPALIGPDRFEPNDSFEAAARFYFDPPPIYVAPKTWGPGDYDATLHQRRILGLGPLSVNEDYFELHAPPETDKRVSQILIGRADCPLDLVLYDSDRKPLGNWAGVRSATISPPPDAISYLKISGAKATRYNISVVRWVDPTVLPADVERAKVLPEWWKNLKFELDEGVNYLGIEVQPERDNSKIVVGPPGQEVGLELVDMHGTVAARAVADQTGRLTISTAGLAAGSYLVRAKANVSARSSGRRPVLQLLAPLDFM